MIWDLKRLAYLGSSTNWEPVIVGETISGDSFVIPSIIIVTGMIYQEQ